MAGLDLDARWIAEQTCDTLIAAVDRDPDALQKSFIAVGDRYGAQGIYVMLCGIADAIASMGGYERDDPEKWYGFNISAPSGELLEPHQVSECGQGTLAAFRFIVAYINGDHDTAFAIFASPETPETAGRFVAALLSVAGAYGRRARQEAGRG